MTSESPAEPCRLHRPPARVIIDGPRSAIKRELSMLSVQPFSQGSRMYVYISYLPTSHSNRGDHGRRAQPGGRKKDGADIQEIHQSMKPPLSPDPNANPRLALALQKAKEGGVPKSGIENVLARVSLSHPRRRNITCGHRRETDDDRLGLLLMDLELG